MKVSENRRDEFHSSPHLFSNILKIRREILGTCEFPSSPLVFKQIFEHMGRPTLLNTGVHLFHNLAEMADPPSSAIVAPFTHAPALLPKNRHAPATSWGVPILPSAVRLSMTSLNFFSVAAIILLSNGPHARVFEVICRRPR